MWTGTIDNLSLSEDAVPRSSQVPLISFAIGMSGLGMLALVYGDFAQLWQPAAAWFPSRTGLAYATGVVMLLGGMGLLLSRTTSWSVRVLLPYLMIGLLLQVPVLVKAPLAFAVGDRGGRVGGGRRDSIAAVEAPAW